MSICNRLFKAVRSSETPLQVALLFGSWQVIVWTNQQKSSPVRANAGLLAGGDRESNAFEINGFHWENVSITSRGKRQSGLAVLYQRSPDFLTELY